MKTDRALKAVVFVAIVCLALAGGYRAGVTEGRRLERADMGDIWMFLPSGWKVRGIDGVYQAATFDATVVALPGNVHCSTID